MERSEFAVHKDCFCLRIDYWLDCQLNGIEYGLKGNGMCYNLIYMTKKSLDYAKRLGANEEEIRGIEEQLRKLEELGGKPAFYHANGFGHPDVPVITNEYPKLIQFYEWGLVPGWVKNTKQAVEMQNKTLNARGETIFEKPSFRDAAKTKRCLVLVDGYYDFFHQDGKKYPFYIYQKNKEPFTLAGLWQMKEIEGIEKKTFTIVTCDANELMKKIHNNPHSSHTSRMPVILPQELQYEWLQPINDPIDKEKIQSLIQPFESSELSAHPVGAILGKNAIGNNEKVIEYHHYIELNEE